MHFQTETPSHPRRRFTPCEDSSLPEGIVNGRRQSSPFPVVGD